MRCCEQIHLDKLSFHTILTVLLLVQMFHATQEEQRSRRSRSQNATGSSGQGSISEVTEATNPSCERLNLQIQYRLSSYDSCQKPSCFSQKFRKVAVFSPGADLYGRLHEEDPEDNGLLVNAVAAHVAGEQSRKALVICLSTFFESFDTVNPELWQLLQAMAIVSRNQARRVFPESVCEGFF